MDVENLFRLALALAIGLLVGLERGWQKRGAPEGTRVAGLRTFGLFGLLGGVGGVLSQALGPWILAASFLALAFLISRGYSVSAARGDRGLTSEAAALVTFALGALAVLGFEKEAAAVVVVMTTLLSLKPVLHGWVERVGRVDLQAALQFLVLSVVVLPHLPDRGYGPWGALNPYHVWLMVVLIAGISFAGYAAVKLLGAKAGIAAASVLGGLVSSTAVALSLSRRDRQEPGAWRLHAGGIVLAATVMFPRVLVEVAAVNAGLLPRLAAPLAAAAAAGLLGAALLIGRAGGASAPASELRNPLQLGAALFFGITLAAVTLAVVALRSRLGDSGMYATAAIAGFLDVDAVALSLARLSRGDLAPQAAADGILIAAAANTLLKAALAAAIARGRAAWPTAGVLAAALAAGAAAHLRFL